MRKFCESRVVECFLYILLCVFVFAATTVVGGWVCYDYGFLLKLDRLFILMFVLVNLVVDFYVVFFTWYWLRLH